MNFSNMKLLKKILSLVVAACMMTTLFTGCMKKESQEPSQPTINLDPIETTEAETQPVPTETEEIDEDMATVLSTLNVRSSPSDQAVQVGTLYTGDKVKVDQVQSPLGVDWGHIYYPITGWVCMEFVAMDNQSDLPSAPDTDDEDNTTDGEEESPLDKLDKDDPTSGNGSTTVLYKGTVTASELNIRKSPSTNAESVGSLKSGTRVEILEKDGNWGRIKQGWISLQHVKLDNGESGSGSNNGTSTPDNGNGSTKVVARGIVNTAQLNIRESASSKSDKVGTYTSGTRVEILEKSNGWGRTNKGWIALNYVYIDGTGTGNNKTGVVTGSQLNIRSGPGTNYASVGSLNEGDEVTILYRVTAGDMVWGNIKQGWISMDYVELDDPDDDFDDESDDDYDDDDILFKGIVTADNLNVRKAPDAESDKVGSLSYGTRVVILEEKGDWGRTSKGWINLDYVYEDGTGDGGDYGTITGDNVNIRSGPGKNYTSVGSLDYGDEVEILFTLKVGGMVWGNIKQGWISMDYVELDDPDDDFDDESDDDYDDDDILFKGIVTADNLNVRKAPDAESDKVGSLSYGTRVVILEEKGDWGRTSKGWINLDYVYEDGTGDGGDYGTITGDNVNIRSGPGKNYTSVGSLDYGDEVEILFTLKVGGMTWGNIEDGWVSMDYVDLD